MQTKITLIIEVPTALIPFEVQYPILAERAGAIPSLVRFESARVLPCADSSTANTHRTLDLYFEDFAAAAIAASTPEADALFAQLAHMSGRFTELISTVTVTYGQPVVPASGFSGRGRAPRPQPVVPSCKTSWKTPSGAAG